jgi:hypothetical protein
MCPAFQPRLLPQRAGGFIAKKLSKAQRLRANIALLDAADG